MYYDKCFDSLPMIQSSDHALSAGYNVYLMTNDKRVSKRARATKEQWACFAKHYPTSKGLHAAWSYNRRVIIVIDGLEHGKQVPMSRICGLLAHEISHHIDDMITQCSIKTMDTEIRAYYMDFILEKALAFWDESCWKQASRDTGKS